MVEVKTIIGSCVGAGTGVVHIVGARTYLDEKVGKIESLKGFGCFSSLSGIVLGGIADAFGIAGIFGKGPIKGSFIAPSLASYGTTALVGGIASGLIPRGPVPSSTPAAPAPVAERPRPVRRAPPKVERPKAQAPRVRVKESVEEKKEREVPVEVY